MKQAIAILLKRNKKIEAIRKRYEPDYKKFKPHISLVYPFQNIPQKQLYEHIEKSIKNIKPFKITLKGLKKSVKAFYLYLLVDKGKNKIIKLYKNLNSKILVGFKNKDMPKYIPHITLGAFKTKSDINKAIKNIKKDKIKAGYIIWEIHLLSLKKDNKIKSIKKFKLK